jgi:adenylyltransferase/sulfurtransferase
MIDRYSRLQPLDIDQTAVKDATIAVVGLGATGSHMAAQLARLGADLILVDRDYLAEANLATSTLYTMDHVEQQLPKATAAASAIREITGDSTVDAQVADVNAATITDLLTDADLIMDGTDNMETRFLLNEYSIRHEIPWIHVAALGRRGAVFPVLPGETACFNCVFADADGAALETCETAGVLNAAAATVANIAVSTAIDILSGETPDGLQRYDLGAGRSRTLAVVRRDDCTVCQGHNSLYLDGEQGSTTTAVCGENKYQINPQRDTGIDLQERADQLASRGTVTVNDHLLRYESADTAFTLFRDGRAIIAADSMADARSVYSRLIGL